jgi:hypothetical protein
VRACAEEAGEDKAASFLQTLLKIELVGTAVPPSWQEGVHYVMQGSKNSSEGRKDSSKDSKDSR